MPAPQHPKIYHIVHVDRLRSIIADTYLWSDAQLLAKQKHEVGTTIGMSRIKARRLHELRLASHPDLYVGECVPFYFCPRSVMRYLIHRRNEELVYKGGQEPIIHLQSDLRRAVTWAEGNGRRWAFTLSNAGSTYFEDRCSLGDVDEVDWDAVGNDGWGYQGASRQVREHKQAEFLLERAFPWHLIEAIGVTSKGVAQLVAQAMSDSQHRPPVEIRRNWYY